MFLDHRIAAAIPAHNEERLIGGTLADIPSYVDLVVVVDDASTDGTAVEIDRAARRDPRIIQRSHPRNSGVGAAIVTAYRVALAAGADVVVVMDGDGQMDPGDLPGLLEPVCQGRADLAKGYRFDGIRARGPMPFARLVGNHVLSLLTRYAAGYGGLLDAQCGYTAISAQALGRIALDSLYPRYGFPNDLAMRVVEAGLRLESVPIKALYGTEVSGIRPHVAIPCILGLLARGFLRRRLPSSRGLVRPKTVEADEG